MRLYKQNNDSWGKVKSLMLFTAAWEQELAIAEIQKE